MNDSCLVVGIVEGLILEHNTTFEFLDWKISNNYEDLLSKIPDVEIFKEQIGLVGFENLATQTFAYRTCRFTPPLTYVNVLHAIFGELKSKLGLLWHFGDNAIFTSRQYSVTSDGGNVGINITDSIISNSKSTYDKVKIDNDFINKIERDNLYGLFYLFHYIKVEATKEEIVASGRGTLLNDGYSYLSRIQRAIMLLSIARTTNLLPMKIGFYINVLECLLLNSGSELNFRLQIHIANLIGINQKDKESITNTMKSAYNIRSKFFHGSVVKQKIDNLQKTSQELDVIIRRVFGKSVELHETINDQAKFDEFIKSLMFS